MGGGITLAKMILLLSKSKAMFANDKHERVDTGRAGYVSM